MKMGLFKSSDRKKGSSDSGMSLLKGMGLLAIIGILLAVLFNYLAA
jgi:hypothetical protein